MDERVRFVGRILDGERIGDLCREFGISRKTGYKFLERYKRLSIVGLQDQPRAPERIPHRTRPEIAELLLNLRREHPTWGPRKLRAYLADKQPGLALPVPSTIGDLLQRSGLVEPRRRRNRTPPSYSPLCHAQAPNDLWCTDFKGQFRLGNKQYCYPLTITDAVSRYLVGCEALQSTESKPAQAVFEQIFRERGLPNRIRTDNGTPFASRALAGLSQLSVWWMRLGITHERTEPASPQQNGRHERMHRTLKAETTRPAAATLLQQQERFDHFVELFNNERPHEALDQRPPATVYQASARKYPDKLPEPEYPLHDDVLLVSRCGHVRLPGTRRHDRNVFLSTALAGQLVGIREINERSWLVSFLSLDLGTVDFETKRLTPLPAPEPPPIHPEK